MSAADDRATPGSNIAVRDLLAVRQSARRALDLADGTMVAFAVADGFRRVADGQGASTRSTEPADVTATAFAIYMLLGPARAYPQGIGARPKTVGGVPLALAHKMIENSLTDDYYIKQGSLASNEVTSTARLPNAYNTPICLAGALVAENELGLAASDRKGRSRRRATRRYTTIANHIAGWVEEYDGGILPTIRTSDDYDHRVSDELPDSHYLWYWTYVSLLETVAYLERCEWLSEDGPAVETIRRCVHASTQLRDMATTRLAYIIAVETSGVTGLFDAGDLLFTMAIAGLRHRRDHDLGSRELINQGLALFMERHLAGEGSIVPRSVAFLDGERNNVTIATSEHAAILLEALHDCCEEHIPSLSRLVEYIVGRRHGRQGWAHDSKRNQRPVKSLFASAASIAFLSRFCILSQAVLERTITADLDIDMTPPGQLSGRPLEATNAELVLREIVVPIMAGRRDLATMSLILRGPPGTGKTSAAEQIALELQWPLVVINQSTFLKKGLESIQAEADKVFAALLHLHDKVVLFDEFEEMIVKRGDSDDRASRFLTSALLPHLEKIRKAKQVVFVIATNHHDRLDPASYRPGRVDRVLNVGHPDGKQRGLIFDRLIAAPDSKTDSPMRLSADVQDHLRLIGFPSGRPRSADVPQSTQKIVDDAPQIDVAISYEEFTYGHINEVIRRLTLIEYESGVSAAHGAVSQTIYDVWATIDEANEVYSKMAE